MKLIFVIAAIVAFVLADDFEKKPRLIEADLQTSASVESQNTQQYVKPTINRYKYVSSTAAPAAWFPPSQYNPVQPAVSTQQNTYFPVQSDYTQGGYNNQADNSYNYGTDTSNSYNNPQTSAPSNSWNGQQNNWNNQQNAGTQNSWNKPQNTGSQNNWNNQQNTGSQNNWNKPQNTGSQNNWNNQQNTESQNTWNKPQNSGTQNNLNTGNNWNNNGNQWNQNAPTTTSTTTPVSVIKNEQTIGDNGSYKYEYEFADGTHVAEEGYVMNPNTEQETIVKKGFYSYKGADGKIYTVTYWADETGYHAVGDHLPKPHPIPPAIQASIDQNAKEEAAKAEAEKNKPQQPATGYPQGQEPPKPIKPMPAPQPIPQQPAQYPQQTYYPQQQQTYYPPQQTYYPSQSGYGK